MNIKTAIAGLLTSFALIGAAHAQGPETPGAAVTLCKIQAEKAHPGYEDAKATNIKQRRGVFKIKMKVLTAEGSERTYCEISREGEVSYQKA